MHTHTPCSLSLSLSLTHTHTHTHLRFLFFPPRCAFEYFNSACSMFAHSSTFMNYRNSESEFDRLVMGEAHISCCFCAALILYLLSCRCLIPFHLVVGGFLWKSWLVFLSVSVEPGVWLSLEGAHCQVLVAGGLHIWLPSDGCHGWLVSCHFHVCFVPLHSLSVDPTRSIHLNYKKTRFY